MDFRVLGPLEVSSGSTVGHLTASKPRQLLALMLLRPSLVVPVDTMSSELWEDEPPSSAQTTIQTYVLHIRRMLASTLGVSQAEVTRDILVTTAGGYRLRVGPGELDLHDYERLVTDGRAALDRGDHDGGSALLSRALGLWRDTALADVRLGAVLRIDVARLEEDRLAAVQQRIDAQMRLDNHQGVLCELGCLAARHPLHEDLQARYMLALYRSGRRTDALDTFHRLRSTLRDGLGLEPSGRLQQLQQAILNADPALDLMGVATGLPGRAGGPQAVAVRAPRSPASIDISQVGLRLGPM
jgi:SARP family transcriptional regulator, regulator of embCAB operon